MSRFVIPAKGMRLNTSGKSSTLAFFTVIDTKIGIEFRDVQLKKRRDGGVFVSAPFRSYERNDGETAYVNFWCPAYDEDAGAYMEEGMAYIKEMAEVAYERYQELLENEESSLRRRRSSRSSGGRTRGKGAPSRRSGRGPVVEDDDEDDDLPF